MNIEIRKYNENDLEGVNKILKQAFSVEKNNFNNTLCCEVVACSDKEVCGYLLLTKVLNPVLNKYYCLVDYVCVLEEYRGLGIAKKLLDYAEDYAKENDAIYLQLSCSTYRTSAHKLYEDCGFIKRDSDLYRKEILWY